MTSYQSIVESLLYAAIATRPDIARAVGVVSKFCANPTQNHLTAKKRIIRYLKATAYLGLRYKCWWKFHWLLRCRLGGWYGWPSFHFRKRVITGWWGSKLAKQKVGYRRIVDNRSRVSSTQYGHSGSKLTKVVGRHGRTSRGTNWNIWRQPRGYFDS